MGRILLVEDEALLRELAFEDLVDLGHAVVAVPTGDEAWVVLTRDPAFDLLFTDIRMPGALDGWALAARARAHVPRLRVIYASGYSADLRPMTAGERFLAKPYRVHEVRAATDELLAEA